MKLPSGTSYTNKMFKHMEPRVSYVTTAAYSLVHRQRGTVPWVSRLREYRICLSAFVQTWNYTLLQFVVNAPNIPASSSFSLCIKINCGFCLARCTLSSNIRRNENIDQLENTTCNMRNPIEISHVNHDFAATDLFCFNSN